MQNRANVAATEDEAKNQGHALGKGYRPVLTLETRINKPYSFRRDKVAKIFRDALNDDIPLPECKRPEDADQSDQPNYCPYHRVLGHPIEDCFMFKNWVEEKYKNGEIELPQSVLQDPAPHTYAQVNMISHKGHTKSQYYA